MNIEVVGEITGNIAPLFFGRSGFMVNYCSAISRLHNHHFNFHREFVRVCVQFKLFLRPARIYHCDLKQFNDSAEELHE